MNLINTLIKLSWEKIEHFFLWSSGAYVAVLEQVPHEKSKYFGIGGTIVFTAIMASLAGGYAFFTAFKSVYLSVFFGMFWGALIFNLDRYIVSSFGVGDGKKTISLQEIKEATPRLLMAILLGFVVATPLELKIFEKEIEVEIEKLKDKKKQEQISGDTVLNSQLSKQKQLVNKLEDDINKLKGEKKSAEENPDYLTVQIKDKEEEVKKKYQIFLTETTKTTGAWQNYIYAKQNNYSQDKISYYLNQYNSFNNLKQNVFTDYQNVDSELSTLKKEGINQIKSSIQNIETKTKQKEVELEKEKNTLDNLRDDEIKRNRLKEDAVKRYDGFAAHLEAMESLTNESPQLLAASWLITLLFIFIEIAPILFKMMTERGSYDDYIDRLKYDALVRQRQKQSDLNDEINMQVKAHSKKMEAQLNAEILSNQQLLNQIAEAQIEITLLAIEEWKKKKLEEIKQDPSKVIKSF
jgi:hypothetical protein